MSDILRLPQCGADISGISGCHLQDCSTLLINANFLEGCLTQALSVADSVQEIEVVYWAGHCSLGCGAHAPKTLFMPSREGVCNWGFFGQDQVNNI